MARQQLAASKRVRYLRVRVHRAKPPLDGQHFDVVVIGGGINGVAVARECARAGRRTLLVEREDFASGTTSRATRIIHGGLRYLEHGELALVRESLHERQRLLAEYPHLVRQLRFLLALPHNKSNRSALEIRFGLWLYRRFAGANLKRPDARSELAALQRQLDTGQRWALFNYEDAQCEFPERLVAEWLLEAAQAGAEVRNHTELLAVEHANGRAHAAVLRDAFSGEEWRVHATWFINATGPWADRVAHDSAVVTGNPMIGGIRGSHLVLARFSGAPESAVYTEAIDGRPIFLVPWNGELLFGTTEVRDNDDPGRTAPEQTEIEYLVRSFGRLFPSVALKPEMVHYAMAGVRPLPYAPEQSMASVTRRHILHDHAEDAAAGMISIIGGKLTTALSVAREVARMIGIRAPEPRVPVIAPAPADGIEIALSEWSRTVAARRGISQATARGLAEWHGRRAGCIAACAQSDEKMRQPLCAHTAHIAAEAVEAVQSEYAATLGDILLRRVPVALGACWSRECSEQASQAVAAALGWTDKERGQQLESFEAERAQFLRKPNVAEVLRRVPAEHAA